ncbi:hypothetical protein Q8A73_002851 [Channa argus]|nr:hypothetical protein Q8A73_002851 [Channa argus]
MTSFSWTAVALLVFAGNCFAAVDQNKLATIVKDMLEKYDPTKQMFSMAVSIPVKKNTEQDYDIDQVFTTENGNKVKEKILSGGVYKEGRIVAAKMNSFSWTAVALLLFAGNSFAAVDQNKLATIVKDMLDKYDPKCMFSMAVSIPLKNTDQDYDINQVFTTENGNKVKEEILSGEQSTSEEQRKQALTNLAEESGLGLENIFRCAKSNDQMLCVSCSTDKQVTPSCVSYDAQQAGTSNTQSSNQK